MHSLFEYIMNYSGYMDERCDICGRRWSWHRLPLPVCQFTIEAIVKRCYQLALSQPRLIVREILMREFPNTHPGFLISVERGLSYDGDMWKTGSLSDEGPKSPIDLSLLINTPQSLWSSSANESTLAAEADDPETLIVNLNSNMDQRTVVYVSADDQRRTRQILQFVQFSLKNEG